MALVFINYRRCDDAYAAALLDFALSSRLGADRIFRASRSFRPALTSRKPSRRRSAAQVSCWW
jgi:hypothetical protein